MKLGMLACMLATALSGAAFDSTAGLKETRPVLIDSTNRIASGALGDARNSADGNQTLGCQRNAVVGAPPQIGCRARGATGGFVGCNSTDPDLVSIVGNIGSDSYLQFGWDSAGNCRFILVDNDSRWAPKSP